MRAARWLSLAACLMAGCITERPIGLELRPPRAADGGPAVPAEVVAIELRLYRTDEGCPTLEDAASARPFARLGQVVSFPLEGDMGDVIGEVPPGRWGLAVLARDATCGVHLYGCTLLDVGVPAPDTLVVELEPVTLAPTCGPCRSCESGTCEPRVVECD